MSRRRARKIAQRAGLYLGALVCVLFFGMPLLWMVSTAFKPERE
jgi:ABC-type glycerol-3-phosphate transport system permease component